MNRVEQLSKKTFFFYLGSPKVTVSGLSCICIMWMSRNPEMIAQSVLDRLERQCRVKVTKGYVCALRRRLNWSSKTMKYGQLISVRNVKHRLDWCVQQLSWFGWPLQECNICWRILCWDVFLWSSIFPPAWTESRPLTREGSKIKTFLQSQCMGRDILQREYGYVHFNGIMDSEIYQEILEDNLLPFAAAQYPDGFRLYQVMEIRYYDRATNYDYMFTFYGFTYKRINRIESA